MQHYAIFLQSFTYEIRYRKSADHSNADALSRLPLAETNNKRDEIELIELNAIEVLPVAVEQLRNATEKDESVRELIGGLRSGHTVKPENRFNIDQMEFTLQKGCLLRGVRVYVPKELRKQVLDELHTAHFGITRMEALARGHCWWPRIDMDIENITKNCAQCQRTRSNPRKVATHVWEAASRPFERVHVDFAGPFMGNYFFILIDAYSKWPEVFVIPNITTAITIEKCRDVFARFGLPEILVSDNGAQFTSDGFQTFLKMNGIVHKRSAPYHPSTNGQAERNVQTFKNKLRTIDCKRPEINKTLNNILLNYRRTPHATTGKSPSMLMFNRQIRTRLDVMIPKAAIDEGTSHNREIINVRRLQVHDRVSVRDYTGDEKYQFGRVAAILGKLHYSVQLDDGRIWRRHIDQIHRIGESIPTPHNDFIPHDYNVSENRDLVSDNTERPSTVVDVPADTGDRQVQVNTSPQQIIRNASPPHNQNASPPLVRNATPSRMAHGIVTEPTSIPEPRQRRVRRPPKRLAYDANGKQVEIEL